MKKEQLASGPISMVDLNMITIEKPKKLNYWHDGDIYVIKVNNPSVGLTDEDLRDSNLKGLPAVEIHHLIKGTYNQYVAKRMLFNPPPCNFGLLRRYDMNVTDGDLRKYVQLWYQFMGNWEHAVKNNKDFEILDQDLRIRYKNA